MQPIQPAHFLKRLTALAIDLCILYAIGFFICLIFKNQILALGSIKPLIGILLSTAYFTYFHSQSRKGQTLGKKIFNFRVVKTNGKFLNEKEAFIRSIIFTIPYCLSDLINISTENSIGFFDFLRFTIIPTSLFINHSFAILNPMRQCYYDYILETIVIGNESNAQINLSSIGWVKFYPAIVFVFVFILGLVRLQPLSEENRLDLKELNEIKNQLTESRDLHFSKFFYTYPKNDPYNKNLKINCYVEDNEDISTQVYVITEKLNSIKEKFQIRKITLAVVNDFNIGIYSSWEVLKKNEKPLKFDL